MKDAATLTWPGLAKFTELFTAYAKELGPECLGPRGHEIKQVLMGPAERIAENARSLVPVVTGTLQSAIYAAEGPADRVGVIVGVDMRKAPYGAAIEYGTSKAAAQPFFRPAVIEMEPELAATIAPGVKEVIEGIAGDYAS